MSCKSFCFFLFLTLLTGCVGSYFVHDDISNLPYQNLATVPNRQKPLEFNVYQKEIDRLRLNHDNILQEKDNLR